MNSEHEDRILEAGLEEILGGYYPPDLSAKILQAWEERSAAEPTVATPSPSTPDPTPRPLPVLQDLLPREPSAPPVQCRQLAVAVPRHRWRRHSNSSWLGVAVAASLLIALLSAGVYVAHTSSQLSERPLVGQPPLGEPLSGPHRVAPQSPLRSAEPPASGLPQDSLRGGELPPVPRVARSDLAGVAPPQADSPRPAAAAGIAPRSDGEVIAFVDQMLDKKWREHQMTPAPAADDASWCRRVYVRLVGREPTVGELRQFVDASQGDKRTQLVDALLASEEYAGHWSGIWAGILQDAGAREPAAGSGGEGLQGYLYTALRQERGYGEIAAELISASGATVSEAEDYNPATDFLADLAHGDRVQATDRVARVFLGKQLICARCHDHPANGWDQSEFWELNAFFRQMKLKQDPHSGVARLVDEDFFGGTGVAKDAEIFFTDDDGRLRVAYPRFGGQAVPNSGLVADVHRRRELARLIVQSPDFRTAVVNRVWAELLRYGFVEPVDDAGPHNLPSHPELLEGLGEQLAAREFDLKGLVRWIVLSQAFGVSDQQTPESWMDTPETGGRPLFARFYAEPKRPADLYRSLMIAVRSRPNLGDQAGTLARKSWSPGTTAVPQIIDTQGAELWAGPQWLDLLAASTISSDEKVRHLFLSVLARKPSNRELMAAKLVLADRMNDHLAVREVWQLLLASRAASRPTALQPSGSANQ